MLVQDAEQSPLQPQFQSACEFIEEARKSGGKTLVHCVSTKRVSNLSLRCSFAAWSSQRVGVSRSATIVIAYLMVYQDQSLMDAYLMTRARRLNGMLRSAGNTDRDWGLTPIPFPTNSSHTAVPFVLARGAPSGKRPQPQCRKFSETQVAMDMARPLSRYRMFSQRDHSAEMKLKHPSYSYSGL